MEISNITIRCLTPLVMEYWKNENIFNGFFQKNMFKTFSIKKIFNDCLQKFREKCYLQDGYSKKKYSWNRNCKQLFDCCSKLKIVKIFVGFKFGVLLGVGIHELVLADLDFGDSWSAWIGLILCLLLGVGNAVSAQIQCISLLTLPSICGRAGRSALKALVLTFILAGPIKNLTTNAHEVVRVFSCTTELTYNLTKTRFDLMYKPFQEALLNMKADTSEMKNTMKSIKKVVNPLSTEIEDENELKKEEEDNDYIDALQGNSKRSEEIEVKYKTNLSDPDGKKYEKMYMKKLETRCEEVISHGTGRCHKMFMKAYDKCYDKVSVMAAWLLCWPMKLTFVCNIMDAMGGGAGVCDPKKEVEPGFGESFAAMKESEDLLEGKKGGMDDVKIKFEPIEFHPPLNFADAKEAALSLQEDFKSKKSTFDIVSRITRMLLSLIFLKVLLRSQEYHDKYIQDFNYDNHWITSYFRRIDARRHAHHKTTLLPLKKAERAELCNVTALIPLPHERKAVLLQFIKILLEAVTATVFILLDRLLSEILLIIRLHSKIDYTQEGNHDLTIKVKGTGMMARLVRSVLGGFNIKQEMHNKRSNLGCLPNPTLINNSYLLKIYGTYFIVWILILLEAYTQRLRRMICSIYYRKIEKRRILFLYNETLKRRANYVKRLAIKLREKFKEAKRSEKKNFIMYLRFQYPKYFGWLYRLTNSSQHRCLVCGLPEKKLGLNMISERAMMDSQIPNAGKINETKVQNWHICQHQECYALYCKECWRDMKEICLICTSKDNYFSQDDPENELYDD